MLVENGCVAITSLDRKDTCGDVTHTGMGLRRLFFITLVRAGFSGMLCDQVEHIILRMQYDARSSPF